MSLAEPRRRRKNPMHSVNLSAPNHWTNDDSKFGQRMLEKFGWSKGSGLGKNEQGIAENIRVQHKVTPTGLGFVAHNADDWFKAGEDYTRLLSQLSETFEQPPALSETNNDVNVKKSLVENSLNSRSRVHYHKFTKGKDLTQYKKEELACILGKGLKNDDQNSTSLNMKDYFAMKRKSKNIPLEEYDKTVTEEESIIIDDKTSACESRKTKFDDNESNATPRKKKKRDLKLSEENECLSPSELEQDNTKKKSEEKVKQEENSVTVLSKHELHKDEKEENENKVIDKEFIEEEFQQSLMTKKRKKKLKNKYLAEGSEQQNELIVKKKKKLPTIKEEITSNDCDNVVSSPPKKKKKKKQEPKTSSEDEDIAECNKTDYINDCKGDENTLEEPKVASTHKYQNLVDLMIENSSAGVKYCKNPPSPLFKKKMEEFAENAKKEYFTVTHSTENKNQENDLPEPVVLNPDDENFIKDFDAQKTKILESIMKRQEISRHINEKSMFIAKHGDILFFGSNINDIKGYGHC